MASSKEDLFLLLLELVCAWSEASGRRRKITQKYNIFVFSFEKTTYIVTI